MRPSPHAGSGSGTAERSRDHHAPHSYRRGHKYPVNLEPNAASSRLAPQPVPCPWLLLISVTLALIVPQFAAALFLAIAVIGFIRTA